MQKTPDVPPRPYRYYEFVMVAFVVVLVCSNLIGPAKIAQLDLPLVGLVTFGAGVLFFPISYVFGDILTEVYGYARSRRVIWAGFAGLAFASFMAYVVVALPPAPFWKNQAAYEGLVKKGVKQKRPPSTKLLETATKMVDDSRAFIVSKTTRLTRLKRSASAS